VSLLAGSDGLSCAVLLLLLLLLLLLPLLLLRCVSIVNHVCVFAVLLTFS
jgi:hypothetical protein